jgi:hypothetical protein
MEQLIDCNGEDVTHLGLTFVSIYDAMHHGNISVSNSSTVACLFLA